VNRKVKETRWLTYTDKLTYHLKMKHFMKVRDVSLINSLVMDARTWMAKNKMKCESEVDYVFMTRCVMAAYMIDEEELKFRALMKDKTNYDNWSHLNKTLNGNLGRTFNPFGLRAKRDVLNVFGGNAMMPASVKPVV
jgi:DUF2075 family protein